MSLIVADTGPLIAFARSNHLALLKEVVGDVVIPATVWAECVQDMSKPAAATIFAAGKSKLLRRVPDVAVPEVLLKAHLDAGETAAIALAIKMQSRLLMDESMGRRVAKLHAVPVVGSAGILIIAKERQLISEVRPILNTWSEFGYRLSAVLIAEVLRRAGE